MRINADFNTIVVVTPEMQTWVDSPQPGVQRVLLDRIGGERARATSLVRYAPGSAFPSHMHPGGEEIVVLEGTFTDEHGDCPRGWYLRHPPGSQHAPSSRDGCLILVKLWQMHADETRAVRMDTGADARWESLADRRRLSLFETADERVHLEHVVGGRPVFVLPEAAAEVLVIAGALRCQRDGIAQRLPAGSWLRAGGQQAEGFLASLMADGEGATVYVKRGRVVAKPDLPAEVRA